jgi:threonylcarbamoyladenosine tRNA methylthiotransferase CDKAL1
VPKEENYMGRLLEVDIVSAGKHYMKAEVVHEAEVRRPVDVPPPLPQGYVSGIPEVSAKYTRQLVGT